MGIATIDSFSLLHFSTGVIAYFWGMPFVWWAVLHALFEIIENTEEGVRFINNYITLWPGGKGRSDSINNMMGDQIFACIGWVVAYLVDRDASGRRGALI